MLYLELEYKWANAIPNGLIWENVSTSMQKGLKILYHTPRNYLYYFTFSAGRPLGVGKRTFADLRVKTRTITELKTSDRSARITSVLGSFLGKCMRDSEFAPLDLGPPGEAEDFVKTWGSQCGVVLVSAKGAHKQSCGFFEALLRGVFGGSSQSRDEMLVLRKKVMSLFLEMWGDDNSIDFRTCAWG